MVWRHRSLCNIVFWHSKFLYSSGLFLYAVILPDMIPDKIIPMKRGITMKRKIKQLIEGIHSATLDLAYVACGRLDGFFERNLKPWAFSGESGFENGEGSGV